MNPTYELNGKVDVSLNGITVPAYLLSDEGATTTFTEMVREIGTMAGVVRQPIPNVFEESNTVFTVVLPNMNYLKNIFPDMYTPSHDRPMVAGRVTFGGNECVVRENTPVVIHYSCQPNSDNDVFIPSGAVQASIELVQNASDPVTVQVTVEAQPSQEHNGIRGWFGTGSLDEPTKWNPVTGQYEPIGSS